MQDVSARDCGGRIDRFSEAVISAAGDKRMDDFREYMCVVCGFVYNEAEGLPEEGFPAGTRWKDIPENWVCPECGAGKEDFEMVEV
jgi:rubredoxin